MKRRVMLINKEIFINCVCTIHGRKELLSKYLQMLSKYVYQNDFLIGHNAQIARPSLRKPMCMEKIVIKLT